MIRKSLEQSTLQALELHETKLGGRLTPNQLLDWLGVDVEAEEEAFEQRQAETKAQSDKENALIRDEEEESASFAIRREIAVQFKTKKPVEIRTTDSELHPLPAGTYDGKITLNVLPDQNEVSPVTYRFSISSSQREIAREGSLRTFYVPWISGVPTEGEFVYWSEAPTAWKEAFERRCIATRILCFDDGRERFPLVIRTTKQCIMTKYSCWYTDLAVSEDGRKIIVRVRDLWCEVWESDIFETEDPNDVELEDVARLNVFCCEMPIETILPVTAPCDEGYDEEEEKEDLNQRVQNIAR